MMERSGRIVLAGGTGFLGQNLAQHLEQAGWEVVLLTRQASADAPRKQCHWDARSLGDWAGSLEGAYALVNLTGRTVDCIKTPEHKDEILRSRVESTRVLGEAVRAVADPPKVWVQMSTAHIHGDPPSLLCDEDAAFGVGLAPIVGKAWEAAFAEAALPAMRRVVVRTSFVLGRSGGALPRLAAITRWGFGGKVGHGRQGISWIHEGDMNRLFERALVDDAMSGAYLATAPNPVSNQEFMRQLRSVLRARIGLPAAAWMVRLGAPLVLKTDPELALLGRYCVSKRLREEGFPFTFPDLQSALHDLYGTPGARPR